VTCPGYVSSAGRHDVEDLAGLLSNQLRRSLDEDIGRVNRAVQEYLVAEAPLEFFEGGPGL